MTKPRSYSDGWLLHGDCLEQLPVAEKPRKGFDLIYVDPPFNTGIAHGARQKAGARATGPSAYVDAWGGLPGFLTMLEPRLQSWHAALAGTGSLWIHLDYRAVHDTKVLADRVFGNAGFQGEVIWIPGNGARGKRGPSVTHQTILIYARSKEFKYHVDSPAAREPYAETSRSMHFKNVDADGRHYRERVINGKHYRYYEDHGRRLGSVWSDCPAMLANTPLIRESSGYPTQKPLKLLERIIQLTTDAGDHVLDPMCGSGTTLVAARRLRRQFVGIDQSPIAVKTAHARLSETHAPEE